MKLPKSLIQAIALGLTVGAVTTSCSELTKDTEDLHLTTCVDGCKADHNKETTWDCPACGMG